MTFLCVCACVGGLSLPSGATGDEYQLQSIVAVEVGETYLLQEIKKH